MKESSYSPRPFLSILGNITPQQLFSLTSKKTEGDGFVPRFLFAWPPAKRPVDDLAKLPDKVPDDLSKAWSAIIARLFKIETDHTLCLTEDSRKVWLERYKTFEKMCPPSGDPMLAVWSKMKAHVARFVLILHALAVADGDRAGTGALCCKVGCETVWGAWDLAMYFYGTSAKALCRMNQAEEVTAADSVWEFIRAKGWKNFTKRDLYQAMKHRTGFGRADDLTRPLAKLCEEKKISPDTPKAGKGRPSEAYEVLSTGSA